jgi:hypothetical protein
VIEGRDSRGQVGLNGEPVGNLRGDAVLADFDVTSQLKIHNNLSIDIEHTGSIAGVRLEIRRRLPVKTSAD